MGLHGVVFYIKPLWSYILVFCLHLFWVVSLHLMKSRYDMGMISSYWVSLVVHDDSWRLETTRCLGGLRWMEDVHMFIVQRESNP